MLLIVSVTLFVKISLLIMFTVKTTGDNNEYLVDICLLISLSAKVGAYNRSDRIFVVKINKESLYNLLSYKKITVNRYAIILKIYVHMYVIFVLCA